MNEETQESQTETAVEATTETTTEKTVETKVEDKSKELQSALAQKDHYREKFEKAEADRKALEAKLKGVAPSLGVEDYIDISASLEGLDQREKSHLAEQHKLTGKPLQEIRNSEDFGLWQSAYRAKVEKERTLKPSGTQTETDRPKSLIEQLQSAKTIQEKEKILSEHGMYKSPRINPSRTRIG